MAVKQIHSIVNNIAKQMLGNSVPTITDTSTFVAVGKAINSTDNVDNFYGALAERIGKTIIKSLVYTSDDRKVAKDKLTFGGILQKITAEIETDTSVSNQSYNPSDRNPFSVSKKATLTQQLFNQLSTWSKEYIVPTYQVRNAFTSESQMESLMNAVYNSIISMIEIEKESLVSFAVNSAIAYNDGGNKTTPTMRKLGSEYNVLLGNLTRKTDNTFEAVTGKTAILGEALLTDKDFLKWADREISLVIDNVKKPSAIYNRGGKIRFAKKSDMVLEVLSHYASASEVYLESDTFHKELVGLPNYEKIPYWQGNGGDFSYNNCSSIKVKVNNTNKEINNVIANLRHVDSVGVLFDEQRINTIYNKRTDEVIYIPKMERSYYIDFNEINITFTLN